MEPIENDIIIQNGEKDSNDAPPPEKININYSNNLLPCPECYSLIEILSLNEENQILEFQCTKNNHNKSKILISEYLEIIEKNNKLKNIKEFKDQCEIHENNYFKSYCFNCKNHLCNECLRNGTHINHKKNNIIEIKPLDKELKIIEEVISDYKIKLSKLKEEKKVKERELKVELKNEKNKENNLLKKEIRLLYLKNKIESEQNVKKYLSEIKEIKKKYEEEIKKVKIKYDEYSNKINNKYKLKKEKQKIKYNLKIDELNISYKNKIDSFQFEKKIRNIHNFIKLNKNIFDLYKSYNNNYFNAMNINNILVSYANNKLINEKMKKILDKDYEMVINMVKDKYNEGIITFKKINEIDELKNKISQEILKSKELGNMNIELSKKNEQKEEEIKKLNQQIKFINEDLNKISKEKEEERNKLKNELAQINESLKNIKEEKNKEEENHIKEKRKLNQIIEEKKNECYEATNNLNKYKKYFKEEMQEIETFQKQNSIIEFHESPYDLGYHEKIVSDRRNSGLLYNIAVYSKNNIGYLVYQNMDFNLIVMMINNEKIISTLKGHKTGIGVIRYYQNKLNKKEEYILSCDNKLLIIWDINDDFYKKYTIEINFKENVFDALILFNVFNKNYIIIASDNQHNYNEYTKLHELKNNISFVKDINNTNKNKNAYLIPWLYKNKYYLIACCDYEISINNIFENENYATLIAKPEGGHYCGFLYNENYLCVSDANNNFIRIWDLVQKSIYKIIEFDAQYGKEMIQWDDKYTIIGCNKCLIIINLEEGKAVKKIERNSNILGVKKIYDDELKECLICSEENNTISIYKTIEEDEDDEMNLLNEY